MGEMLAASVRPVEHRRCVECTGGFVVPAVPVHVRCWPRGLARTAPWHTRSRHTKLQSTRCSARTHARTAVRRAITTRSTSPPLSTPVTAPRGEPFQSNCGIQTRSAAPADPHQPQCRAACTPEAIFDSIRSRLRGACGRPPSPPVFGPFRRKNGRRQCPSAPFPVTKLGRTAVVIPTARPTKFRGRNLWGGYSSGRHHSSIGGCGQ